MRVYIAVALFATALSSMGCLGDRPVTDVEHTGSLDAAGGRTGATELDEANNFAEIIARHGDDHDRLANNAPVRDATGVFTTASAHGRAVAVLLQQGMRDLEARMGAALESFRQHSENLTTIPGSVTSPRTLQVVEHLYRWSCRGSCQRALRRVSRHAS